MRKKPWEFIERAMLDARDVADADGPRMLVVTGMGGCGKTQLMLKFIQVHKNKSVISPGSFYFLRLYKIRSSIIHRRQYYPSNSRRYYPPCTLFGRRTLSEGVRRLPPVSRPA
jgi:tRNA A37 threonylcarbamoyladenosine biosynthesis protein TsaE